MGTKDLGPELKAVDSLPAVDLLVRVLGLCGQRGSEREGELADRGEGVGVGSSRFNPKAPHFNTAGGHEGNVWDARSADELCIGQEGAVAARERQR